MEAKMQMQAEREAQIDNLKTCVAILEHDRDNAKVVADGLNTRLAQVELWPSPNECLVPWKPCFCIATF